MADVKVLELQVASNLKELRDNIMRCRNELVKLEENTDEYVAVSKQLYNEEQKLVKVMSASKNAITPYERSLKALTDSYANQRQELKALRTALENLTPGTKEYEQAFTRAADITHELQERQELLRRSSSDLGVQLSNMQQIGTGLAAGFTSVSAIMSIMGNDSEDVQKAMLKMQQGIALVQGIKGLEGLTKAVKGYINGAAKWFDSIKNAISGNKQLATTTQSVAAAENSAAAGANVETAALKTQTTATVTATAAATALKAVLMSLGIGVVVAALGGLINLLSKIGSKSKENFEKGATAAENYLDNVEKANDKLKENYDRVKELMELRGASAKELRDLELAYTKDVIDAYNKEADAIEKTIQKAQDSGVKRGGSKLTRKKLGFDEDDFKNVEIMKARIEEFGSVSDTIWNSWDDATKKAFNDIKKDGIKNLNDLLAAQKIFLDLSKQNIENMMTDTVGSLNFNIERDYTELMGWVDDQLMTEAEKTSRTAAQKIQIVIDRYEELKRQEEEYFAAGGIGPSGNWGPQQEKDLARLKEALKKAQKSRKVSAKVEVDTDLKKAEEIVKATENATKTELELLYKKYEEDKKLVSEKIKDEEKKNATLLALEKIYNEKKNQIEYQAEVKRYENNKKIADLTPKDDKELARILGLPGTEAVKQYYAHMHKIQVDALTEEIENEKKFEEDERATEEQRLEHKAKRLQKEKELREENAKNAKETTDRLIEQIQRETNAELEKSRLSFTSAHTSSSIGAVLFKTDSATNSELKTQIDAEYQIIKEGLEKEKQELVKYYNSLDEADARRIDYKQKIDEKDAEIAAAKIQRDLEVTQVEKESLQMMLDNSIAIANSFADILGSIASTMEAYVDRQVAAGEMTTEEADKQREKIKSIQIAQAIVNTIAGVVGAFMGITEGTGGFGIAAAALEAAGVLAAGVASIAQMQATTKNTKTLKSLPMATPKVSDYNPNYNINMTGNSELTNLRNALEGTTIRAWISETDLEESEKRRDTRKNESTF